MEDGTPQTYRDGLTSGSWYNRLAWMALVLKHCTDVYERFRIRRLIEQGRYDEATARTTLIITSSVQSINNQLMEEELQGKR